MTNRMARLSPRLKARVAGLFYLGTFVAGTLALVLADGTLAANLIATACYVAVTLLFFDLFNAVDKTISFVAAVFGLVGCTVGTLAALHRAPTWINSLVLFGCYCLLIGYLILRSTFLPRILGILMGLGGLGWLTFLSPSLAHRLNPFNLLPGAVGEGALTLWLLAMGVNAQRWNEQARAQPGSRPARQAPDRW